LIIQDKKAAEIFSGFFVYFLGKITPYLFPIKQRCPHPIPHSQ
jgi:hypothetical protein